MLFMALPFSLSTQGTDSAFKFLMFYITIFYSIFLRTNAIIIGSMCALLYIYVYNWYATNFTQESYVSLIKNHIFHMKYKDLNSTYIVPSVEQSLPIFIKYVMHTSLSSFLYCFYSLFQKMSLKMENMNEELIKEKEDNNKELIIAEKLQESISKIIPNDLYRNYDFAFYQKQSHGVGGDFFKISKEGDDYLVTLIDVCGHNISTAMIVFYLKSLTDMIPNKSIEYFVGELNLRFYEFLTYNKIDSYAVSSFLEFSPIKDKIKILNGGCFYFIVNRDKCEFQENNLIYLGIKRNIRPEYLEIEIEEESIIFLFTDGLVENSYSFNYSKYIDDFISIIQKHFDERLEVIKNELMMYYNHIISNKKDIDDTTFILLKKY